MASSRTALVHDYLNQRGGAERVFAHIAKAYPDAPIYTSILDESAVRDLLDVRRVQTSFLQKIPFSKPRFRMLAPLFPTAFEAFDLSAYDVIVSSTTAWAKGVRFRPDAVHVCYINTVSRFAFSYDEYVAKLVRAKLPNSVRRMVEKLVRSQVDRLVTWDTAAAARPTAYIANSRNVAARVKAYYHRDAFVLPCPVDVDAFYLGAGNGGYAIVISRLLPYKRVDLAIAACAQAGMTLLIVGTGPAENELLEAARGTRTHFMGQVDDATRAKLLAEAEIVILPAEEDFGLVPVEAAAAGRPCLAYRAGGALETIREHETGEFFDELKPESMAAALCTYRDVKYDSALLRRHAETFAPPQFIARLHEIVEHVRTTGQSAPQN